jgi:hypothetical protein
LVFKEANSKDKLKMNWQGPFRVVKKEMIQVGEGWKERDDAYVLQCVGTGKLQTVSIHRMKPFAFRSDLDLQAMWQKDSNEWLVERIINHEGDPKHKSKMEFEVKWVGLDTSFNRWLS